MASQLRDIWRFRDLLALLIHRNVTIKYKQAYFGLAWLLFQPVITLIVLTVVFGHIAALPSDGMPYSVLTLAGILPWQICSEALSTASQSIVGARAMVTKVYFPRLTLPLSAVIASGLECLLPCALLPVLMLWHHMALSWRLTLLPVFLLLAAFFATGMSLWLAALNVRYRDVKHAVPLILRLGLYMSPVGFLSTAVPAPWRPWYAINPMVGIIDACRWTLGGARAAMPWFSVLSACVISTIMFAGGLWFFGRTERLFADTL